VRRTLGAVAAASALVVAARAGAQSPAASGVQLTWNAPSECPARADVEREVNQILSASTAPASAVSARADVTRAGEKWHVELAIASSEGRGERQLDATSCAELGSAVALIVALAVDPGARPPPPPLDDAGAPEAAVSAAPSSSARALRPASEPTSLGVAVAADVVADSATLPSTGVGGELAIALVADRLRVEGRGRLFASQRALDPAKSTQGVDVALLGGGLRACFAVLAGTVALAPCAGGGVERLSADGFGGNASFSRDAAFASLDGGALLTWSFTRWLALRAELDGVVPLARPSFVVLRADGSVAEVLHRPSSVAARTGLGIELHFF
jgi:hypothetical protein